MLLFSCDWSHQGIVKIGSPRPLDQSDGRLVLLFLRPNWGGNFSLPMHSAQTKPRYEDRTSFRHKNYLWRGSEEPVCEEPLWIPRPSDSSEKWVIWPSVYSFFKTLGKPERRLWFGFLILYRPARLVAASIVYTMLALLTHFAPRAVPYRELKLGPFVLREYLQVCGGAFIKLGQILAHRYDLLPYRYCHELLTLLDEVDEEEVSEIQKVIDRDLAANGQWRCLQDLEKKPLATASIAQVHAATLPSGESVVVKVMRPGTKKIFAADGIWLMIAAFLAQLIPKIGAAKPRELVREINKLRDEEFDFRREARNLSQLRDCMLRDEIDHYAPAVYFHLSGDEVITMERIEGVSFKQLGVAVRDCDDAALDHWEKDNITPHRAACLLVRSFLEQALHHRIFHADPHAANLIMMKGGTLAWVDFGMVGWLDELQWKQEYSLRLAIAEREYHEAYEHLLDTLEPLPAKDLRDFESNIKNAMHEWITAVDNPASTPKEKSAGIFFIACLRAIGKANLHLPYGLLRLYRTIIVGDMVMLSLDDSLQWRKHLQEFVADDEQRQIKESILKGPSPSQFKQLLNTWLDWPRTLHHLAEFSRTLPRFSHRTGERLKGAHKAQFTAIGIARDVVPVVTLLALLGSFNASIRNAMNNLVSIEIPFQGQVFVIEPKWPIFIIAGTVTWLLLRRLVIAYQE